jgi:GldM C-terminal domain
VNKKIYNTAFLIFISCSLFAQVKIITRADSLFIGIDNEVIIQSSKIAVEKLSINVNGGTVSGSNGKYIIHCSAPNTDASIKIFYRKNLVAEKKLAVLRISDPLIFVAGDTLVREGVISKKHLLTFNSLVVKTNVPFLALSVIRFDFKRMSNNILTDSLKNEGYILSLEIKRSLKKAMKGDVIIFENAFSTGADDNSTYRQLIKLIVSD